MSDERSATTNKEYKDRLFCFIFGSEEHKEWTLSLYNAINGSHYTDASLIEFNTLKEVLYLKMRNDTSFLISDILSVYEHQSSYNPNMPLRLLGYVDDLFAGYVKRNKFNKYGEKLIMLPIPKLVVLYNGIIEKEDEVFLKLSDSFDEKHRTESDVEVRVRMLNVNYGHNKELMEACRPLSEYSWFINEIRNNQNTQDLKTSIDLAIQTMPEDWGLKGFLVGHKAEVEGMLDTEYNEAEVKELFKEEGRQEGIQEGYEQGRKEREALKSEIEIMREKINQLELLLASK